MKKIRFNIAAAAAIVMAAACTKEPADTVSLSVSAGFESETKAYLEAGVIKWKSSDLLTVYDTSGKGVDLTTTASGVTSATFSTNRWTGKVPVYASSYTAEYGEERIVECETSGIIPLRIRKSQSNHSWKGCSSPFANASVGKIEEQEGKHVISQMKNVPGYIGVKVAYADVSKITVSSIGGEALAGWINVDYAKLAASDSDFWSLMDNETPETVVTASLASSGGSIVDGCFGVGTYYIALLPQTYESGLRIVTYDKAGEVFTENTIGAKNGITIKRNEITPVLTALDAINLPDEVQIDLDFKSGTNPFGFGELTAAQESTTSGENYPVTYNFTDPKTGLPNSTDFIFTICRTSTAGTRYYYANKTDNAYGQGYVLLFDANNSWMALPAIDGRYLSEITISIANGYAKEFNIKTSGSATSSVAIVKVNAATSSGPSTKTLHFYSNGNDGTNTGLQGNTVKIGTPYYFQMRSAGGSRIAQLRLKYTKSLTTKP